MAAIRVIKTNAGQIVIQHAPSGRYDDGNLPIPKAEVAEELLTTHEELAAAGASDSSQVDIRDGRLAVARATPTYQEQVQAQREAALRKLGELPGDASIPGPVRTYFVAILEALGIGTYALRDPSRREHG